MNEKKNYKKWIPSKLAVLSEKIQIGQEFAFKLNITCFYYEFSHYYFDKISYKCKKHKCLNCYFTILKVSQIYRFKICIIIFCFFKYVFNYLAFMKKIADSLSIENNVPKKLFLCNKWIKKYFSKNKKINNCNFKSLREKLW